MGTIFQLPTVELPSHHLSRFTHHVSRIAQHSTGPATCDVQSATAPATLLDTLRHLRSQNIHCIAAHPHATGRTLSKADFKRDCCILFGSEGHGISQPLLDLCHEAVAIPMAPNIDSLNISAAAAIFLYEAHRQRGRRWETAGKE
jgi:23S rRNA (guanosine2251-2'-O)-methyltransferase